MPYRPKRKGGPCTLPTTEAQQEAELARLLARHAEWGVGELDSLQGVKQYIVGRQSKLPPLAAYGNNYYDRLSMGWWDAFRRASMLEPLAADVLFGPTPVPGDFMEVGVFKGGISLFMASMLRVAGVLGPRPPKRRLWMADAFGKGMPGPEYSRRVMRRESILNSSIQTQNKNWEHQFAGVELSLEAVSARLVQGLGVDRGDEPSAVKALEAEGVYSLPGYFNETLGGGTSWPTGISRPLPARAAPLALPRRLALLRIDVDEFAATLEVLQALYPRLSVGGYVVLDDWKIWQAQQAALHYRKVHNITSPIFASQRKWAPPLQTIDCMAFWRKDA